MSASTSLKYKKPTILFNTHFETIFPALFRNVSFDYTERQRLITEDQDFIDVDWFKNDSSKLAIICHGLEGDSERPYVKGMARELSSSGFDILSINYRGCSGEINQKRRFYHSGATDDVKLVIDSAIETGIYDTLVLVGFSMGGNMILKYLGEEGDQIPKQVQKALVFSVPLLLEKSSRRLEKYYNFFYAHRFLKRLKKKVILKSQMYPDIYPLNDLSKIRKIFDFDEKITAPIHGFDSASDYYTKSSSMFFLEKIQIPTMIVNARNDTFLAPECFDVDHLQFHQHLIFNFQEEGGHCGFSLFRNNGRYWSEVLAKEYFGDL